jgi:CP family cyanate transporter-like MFS transporter
VTRHAAGASGGVAAVLLLSVALRAPVVAPAPILTLAERDLHVSSGVAALLVAVPVLCFGLCAAPAAWLVARLGTRAATLVALAGIVAALLLRVSWGFTGAVAGTVLLGVAITIANVVLPVLASIGDRRHAERLTTRYTVGMNLASLAATVLTAPLAAVVDWRVAVTAPWVLACLLAAVAVARTASVRSAAGRAATESGGARRPWRYLTPVLLMVAFSGQTLSYYGITAWLPTQLDDLMGFGLVIAGGSAAVFQLTGAAGPLLMSSVLRAGRIQVGFAVVTVLWMLFPLGMLALPGAWWLWALAAGAAQGATFTLVLTGVNRWAATPTEARRAGALVQGGGYAVGAFGPVLLGALHSASGGWTVPMLAVLAAAAALGAAGIGSATRSSAGAPSSTIPEPVVVRP